MVPIHPAEKPDAPHVIATLTASVGNELGLLRKPHLEGGGDQQFNGFVTRREEREGTKREDATASRSI